MRALDLAKTWGAARFGVGVRSVEPEATVTTAGDVTGTFRLASVTKPLFAYAVLVAAEEGSLSLDDPCGPAGSTVRHLLAHASGLAPDDRRPLAEPGVSRIYSNAGYEVLGEHLEACTGFTAAGYTTAAVFEPLGMSHTTLTGSPAHGASSTVEDLLRFAAELQSPALVSRRTLETATSVQFTGLVGVLPGFGRQTPNDWGLGFEVRGHKAPHWTAPAGSPRTFGHFGRSGTFLWVDPDAGVACVALTDRAFGPWAVGAWPVFSAAALAEQDRQPT
jgi:CubicO group peptidase (beta-lactamase class C family)